MISLNITTSGVHEVENALKDVGVQIVPLTRKRIYTRLLGIRNKMAASAPRPGHPIHWDSIRQMRAFYASNGFGHGIPTIRTRQHEHAWRVVKAGDGYAIENPLDTAIYLYGDADGRGQSAIHQGRWPLFVDKIEDEINAIPREAERDIEAYADKKGL